MTYRTKTYIAADWDNDKKAVDTLYKWNESNYWSFSFNNAHDLQQSRDTSLPCSIKRSLKERMDSSKTFVLIVGDITKRLTKGGCQMCSSYNSWGKFCTRNHSLDYRSYIDYECEKAKESGIKIVVLYYSTRIDLEKCPEILRNTGIHLQMLNYEHGKLQWNYFDIKYAIEN